MKKKRLDSPHPHPGQIPTNMKTYSLEFLYYGAAAIESLFKCFIHDTNSFQQKNQIILTASLFERISCLIYLCKDGYYSKLPVSKYYEVIFEGSAETPEEIYYFLKRYGVTFEQAEHIFKLVWQVADLICPMMACISEQASISEYAYAIEYVIQHNGDLPKPEITILFPTNYADYRYQEGIAETIRNYECN